MSDSMVSVQFIPTFWQRYKAGLILSTQGFMGKVATALFPTAGILILAMNLITKSKISAFDWLVIFSALFFTPIVSCITTLSAHRKFKGDIVSLIFDANGIKSTRKTVRISHGWPEIIKVVRSNGLLLSYFSTRCAYFAPIDAFTKDQVLAIRALAEKHGNAKIGI
ncbi:YcxB family protein [Solilutibacter silvestris]|uniref:YcxB family protein n=1 Tax=Solilutibacter silvestris TaxID=1645665 RepID=UPI003D34F6A8